MSSSQVLHPTARAILRYVVAYKTQHCGDSPTRREIQSGVGVASPSMVHHHLVMLARAGRVTLDGRRIGVPGAVWTPPQTRSG